MNLFPCKPKWWCIEFFCYTCVNCVNFKASESNTISNLYNQEMEMNTSF